jgi:ribose-phosphate pyrophosphokinase
MEEISVLAPDAGASKAVEQFAHQHGYPFIQALKTRDTETGELHGFRITNPSEDVEGKNILILDDICDGGGTFEGIADELDKMGARSVALAVTHGIFSRGFFIGMDRIYTTNSYRNAEDFRHQHVSVYDIYTPERRYSQWEN